MDIFILKLSNFGIKRNWSLRIRFLLNENVNKIITRLDIEIKNATNEKNIKIPENLNYMLTYEIKFTNPIRYFKK